MVFVVRCTDGYISISGPIRSGAAVDSGKL